MLWYILVLLNLLEKCGRCLLIHKGTYTKTAHYRKTCMYMYERLSFPIAAMFPCVVSYIFFPLSELLVLCNVVGVTVDDVTYVTL